MNLLQAAEEDRRGMTSVWLARLPSLAEFAKVPDDPERWKARPVWNLPVSYAGAASVLMEKMINLASEGKYEACALLPPYLFLWRHHFEMRLKSILKSVADNPSKWSAATGQSVPSDLYNKKMSRTHGLLSLWERVQPMAEIVQANETHMWQLPSLTTTNITELIKQLDDIDPRGDGARYTRDTKGDLTMLKVNRIDLEHAERNMQYIAEFLRWARLEIGVTTINLPYEADEAETRRLVEWQAVSDEEFI
jgi:hypothetical protein